MKGKSLNNLIDYDCNVNINVVNSIAQVNNSTKLQKELYYFHCHFPK